MLDELSDLLEEDQPVLDEALGQIGILVNSMLTMDKTIEDFETQLKALKEQRKELSDKQIPDLIMEYGLSELKCADGTKVTISRFYSAKIPDDKKGEAFAWLEQTGNDSIIKATVSCAFGKGEKEREKEELVIKALEEVGAQFSQQRGVHPMTLKSFVKEQVENGSDIPHDLFGIFIGNTVKVKRS